AAPPGTRRGEPWRSLPHLPPAPAEGKGLGFPLLPLRAPVHCNGRHRPEGYPEGRGMAKKKFWLRAEQVRPLIPTRGGCIASDRITVDGRLVGYMYREGPAHDLDNGWRFLAGDESPEYMADADNHGVYDVNTIANLDTAIIPLLDAPEGSAFERD